MLVAAIMLLFVAAAAAGRAWLLMEGQENAPLRKLPPPEEDEIPPQLPSSGPYRTSEGGEIIICLLEMAAVRQNPSQIRPMFGEPLAPLSGDARRRLRGIGISEQRNDRVFQRNVGNRIEHRIYCDRIGCIWVNRARVSRAAEA